MNSARHHPDDPVNNYKEDFINYIRNKIGEKIPDTFERDAILGLVLMGISLPQQSLITPPFCLSPALSEPEPSTSSGYNSVRSNLELSPTTSATSQMETDSESVNEEPLPITTYVNRSFNFPPLAKTVANLYTRLNIITPPASPPIPGAIQTIPTERLPMKKRPTGSYTIRPPVLRDRVLREPVTDKYIKNELDHLQEDAMDVRSEFCCKALVERPFYVAYNPNKSRVQPLPDEMNTTMAFKRCTQRTASRISRAKNKLHMRLVEIDNASGRKIIRQLSLKAIHAQNTVAENEKEYYELYDNDRVIRGCREYIGFLDKRIRCFERKYHFEYTNHQ